ncbi:hypothetical protein B0H17DRAFT_1123864 [Mycena rosella]|uniref:Uncharacterized protein n=1 Tax=Mycena rosella TaxID=1033263 RepID=A0AAD7MCS6_MYCRO|nr:hypothetical protein B0H17DRAFT_1123864 [Mycena rosella]
MSFRMMCKYLVRLQPAVARGPVSVVRDRGFIHSGTYFPRNTSPLDGDGILQGVASDLDSFTRAHCSLVKSAPNRAVGSMPIWRINQATVKLPTNMTNQQCSRRRWLLLNVVFFRKGVGTGGGDYSALDPTVLDWFGFSLKINGRSAFNFDELRHTTCRFIREQSHDPRNLPPPQYSGYRPSWQTLPSLPQDLHIKANIKIEDNALNPNSTTSLQFPFARYVYICGTISEEVMSAEKPNQLRPDTVFPVARHRLKKGKPAHRAGVRKYIQHQVPIRALGEALRRMSFPSRFHLAHLPAADVSAFTLPAEAM